MWNLRYTIDWKNHIVDLYIEDDAGKEVHEGLDFEQFLDLFREIRLEIDPDYKVWDES